MNDKGEQTEIWEKNVQFILKTSITNILQLYIKF